MEYNEEEIKQKTKKYVLPGIMIGIGLTGYFQNFQPFNLAKYLIIGFSVFAVRETSQRLIARYMAASVETKFSIEGTSVTLLTAAFSTAAKVPFALLIPCTNSFSQKRYEHWGKAVDAMWSKRQFWVATTGTTVLTLTAALFHGLNYDIIVQGFTLFTLTNLIPLRDLLIEGSTDGTYILFHSGFTYLLLAGLNIVMLGYAAF